MLGEPVRQHFSVSNAALPKARIRPDLRSVALGGAAREIKRRELAGRDADLASEVRDRVVGQLLQGPWKATTPENELQQRGEAEPRRARLVAQQVELVADQREVIDDVVETEVARHHRLVGSQRSGCWASSASTPQGDSATAKLRPTGPPPTITTDVRGGRRRRSQWMSATSRRHRGLTVRLRICTPARSSSTSKTPSLAAAKIKAGRRSRSDVLEHVVGCSACRR